MAFSWFIATLLFGPNHYFWNHKNVIPSKPFIYWNKFMPNPSASSKKNWLCSKFFDHVQYFLNVGKYFWPCSNMQIHKVKYHFWPWSTKFECVQKYCTHGQKNLNMFQKNWPQSKKFEHGQNIFELADGIGITKQMYNGLPYVSKVFFLLS